MMSYSSKQLKNRMLALLFISGLSLPAGYGMDNAQALAQLEHHFLFSTHAKDSLETRLSRLEKQVFGSVFTGSPDERLQRLLESQNAPINPDLSMPQTAVATRQISDDQVVARPPSLPNAAKSDEPDEQDCAIERAKVAIKAAKEEEIDHLLAEGVELWRSQRGEEALERFEQVIRLDRNNAQAHFSLGIIEESEGNYVEALASYRQACLLKPKNKDYNDAMASVEKKLNSKQAVVAKRSEISHLAEEATAAYGRGEYLSALDLYKQLDQKTPGHALVKYNIGSIYLMLKEPEKALEYYKQAHKLSPEDRYAKAYDELNAVVERDQTAVRQNESQSAEKSSAGKQASLPANQSMLAGLGILGKNGADGVCITTVGIASRASKVGLMRGDVIKAVDGTMIKSTKELNDLLSQKSPGQILQLIVQRDKTLSQVAL